jgi:hypothetical protein
MLKLCASHFYVNVLCSRLVQLGLCLGHIPIGCDAPMKSSYRQLEKALILLDGVVEQLLLRVLSAQLEVVHGELGAQTEIHIGKVCGGGLRVFARLLYGAADAAPKIGFPRRLPGNGDVGVTTAPDGSAERPVR